jgi:hypothetical protein
LPLRLRRARNRDGRQDTGCADRRGVPRRHPSSRVSREPPGRLWPLLPHANDRDGHGRAARDRARRGNFTGRCPRPAWDRACLG